MRICLLGNVELAHSSESYYVKTLREMGHEVTALQETKVTGEEILEKALNSDLFVWVHGHNDTTPGLSMKDVLMKLKEKGIPTMTWHHDLFPGTSRASKILEEDVYKYIDHFFSTDQQLVNWVNKETKVKGHYLPSAVYGGETAMFTKKENGNDVIFVGSKGYHPEWPYRPELIKWLEDNYENFGWYSGEEGSLGLKRGWDMNQLFADSKVVIGDTFCPNFDYPHYWSDRIWETLGRGGFIIHPYIVGLEKYFEDGKHLVFYEYGDFKDLRCKIDFYLENNNAREKIRKQGYELVKNKHTYERRWQSIFRELGL